MFKLMLGLCAFGLATPALANDSATPRPAPDAAHIGAMLSNPLVQEGVAATVDQFADALLQTHVGPLAKLTDPRDHVRANDTLADLAARQHPNYRQDLHDQTRQAVAATGQAAHDMAAFSSEIRKTSERLRAVLKQTQSKVDALR